LHGGEGDLKSGYLVVRFVGFGKAEAKAESSELCQSCTAEGVHVSIAEEKKNIYGFQQ